MTSARWRSAFASVIGTSHARTGAPCQDAGTCFVFECADGTEILVVVASDGAGSAPRSEAGAALAVSRFVETFSSAASIDPSLQVVDRDFVVDWISAFQKAVAELAAGEGRLPPDYACTLLGAVVGPSSAVYVQVGDGAIVVGTEEPGEYSWVFWPQHGEFANQTSFLTQEDAATVLSFEHGPTVAEIAVFTDGIERLVLDIGSRQVHAPAFRPIFEWLSRTEPDRSGQPSDAILAYLGSDHINARTDDDKTLVIATRSSCVAGLEPSGAK